MKNFEKLLEEKSSAEITERKFQSARFDVQLAKCTGDKSSVKRARANVMSAMVGLDGAK
jgi:hypothetical protein